MNYFYCLILLLLSFTVVSSRSHPKNLDRSLEKYLKERSGDINEVNNPSSNEEFIARRRFIFSHLPIQQYQPQVQPMCLPHIWTCGPRLPPCCPGLMCYDGNAKRGRHCVARG